MNSIVNLIMKWNTELNNNGPSIENYNDIWDSIRILEEYKFNDYQPSLPPLDKPFNEQLIDWLLNFDDSDEKFLFYLVSKILFVTHKQYDFLIQNLYYNHIKRIILDDIIIKYSSLEFFDYKEANSFLKMEIEKTLVVGLTDSSRINLFSHIIPDFDRSRDYCESLQILTYPALQKKIHTGKNADLCEDFSEKIIKQDPILNQKERLIILEDFSGSGEDIKTAIDTLEKSKLPFKTIIIAIYVISYDAKFKIDTEIANINLKIGYKKYYLCYGMKISKNNMCFDNSESYLNFGWIDPKYNICNEVKRICDEYYDKNIAYSDILPKYGYGDLKISFISHFNCPDNTLPIIWFDKNNYNPLFKRSSRYI